MPRERQCPTIEGQRRGKIAASMMNIRQTADRGEVFWRGLEHKAQFGLGGVELIGFNERSPQRDACREVSGVSGEAGPTRFDGFFEAAGATVFFAELGKRNRGRVFLDPSSKLFDAGIVSHNRC